MAGEFYEEDKWIKGKIKDIVAALGDGSAGLDALRALILEIQNNIIAFINTKAGANTDAAGTLTLFARLRQIVDTYLADGAIGLAALKALIDAIEANLDDAGHGLVAIMNGIAANWIKIDGVEAKLDGPMGLATLVALLDALEDKLDDGTTGLAALKALTDTIEATLDDTIAPKIDEIRLSDHDEFDVPAAAPVVTERWSGEPMLAAEGSTGDIDTTRPGKGYVLANPTSPLATGYMLRHKPARESRYFSAIVDAAYTWPAPGTLGTYGGIMVTKGAAHDINNSLYLSRQRDSTPNNRITVTGSLGGVGITPAYAAVNADALALKIERWGNIWRFYYSLTPYPNYSWVFVAQLADTAGNMGRTTSIGLFSRSRADYIGETLEVDFDNFRYVNLFGYLEDIIGTPAGDSVSADIAAVAANSAKVSKILSPIDLPWSTITSQVQVSTVAGDKTLGTITVGGLPAGVTVARILVLVKFSDRDNSNAAVNSVSGAQNIQVKKNADAFVTCLALGGGEYATPASTTGATGDVMMGTVDVSALAPANGDTLTVQWTQALSAQNNLNFNNIQVGARIYFSV